MIRQFSTLFFSLFLVIVLAAACGPSKPGNTDVKIVMQFQNESDAQTQTKAITPGEILYAAVGYKGAFGKGYYQLPIGPATTSSELSFNVPNGPTRISVWVFTSGQLYYDSVFQPLSGGNITINLAPVNTDLSPHKVTGTITVKNEANVAVSNQKIGLKHDAWPSGEYFYTGTTNAAGEFSYSKFLRENDFIIHVLDENNTVMRTLNYSVPTIDSFTAEVGYTVSTGYCSAFITSATCSVTGCVWMGDRCESQFGINCGLGEAACRATPGCYWNITTMGCDRAAAVSCAGKPVAQCTGACSWNSTSSYCMNASTISCSANVTEATCMTPCFWERTTATTGQCRNAMITSCATYLTQATCTTTPACLWNMTTATCQNAMSYDCAANVTSPTCITNASCIWDTATSSCKNAMSVSCSANVTQATCITTGGGTCVWDSALSTCRNAMSIDCASYVTSPTCATQPGCTWNSATSVCSRMIGTDCASFITSTTCSGNTACVWNATYCAPMMASSCSAKTDSATCIADPACTWSLVGAAHSCVNKTNVVCSTMTMATCVAPCYWDTPTNTCTNMSTTNCSSYGTQPTCVAPCYWNSGNNSCQNMSGTTCSSYTSSITCVAPCYWNAVTCQNSVGGTCESNTNFTNCNNNSLCSWNNNINQCRGKYYACPLAITEPTCQPYESRCNWISGSCVAY
ncbi:MAG: hypothetical protein HQK52_13235 [Oligoflexia bacterium]|nr:hypothetical protein [Oligoflexia bacterium]